MKDKIKRIWQKYIKLSYLSIFLSLVAIILGTVFFVIYASCSGKASVEKILPSFIVQMATNTRDGIKDLKYVFHKFPESSLPVYKLDISKDNLKKLESNIPDLEARKDSPGYVDGVDDRLADENRDYVPAKFTFEGRVYDVKVRFRGNGPPHWTFPKKSFRIRFSKDDLFFGKQDINLVIPLDRRYLAEEFNNYRAEKMGLVVPDSKFVAVEINGDKQALYWEVEHFTKEFVESHNLSGDANLYGEGDTFQQHLYTDENYWQKYVSDPSKRENEHTQISLLISLLNDADNETFYKRIFDILDEENFYKWTIHNLLAGSWHQDYSHNARIYFDKSIGKFIFLPWDVYVYDNEHTTESLDYALEATANPLVDRLFSNEKIMHKRNAMLWEYVMDDKNLEDDLNHYDELFESVQKVFYNDPIRRHSYDFFAQEVNSTRSDLAKNFNQIKYLFENSEASFVISNSNDNSNLSLEVASFKTFAPVHLDKVIFEYNEDIELKNFDVYKDGQLLCSSSGAQIDQAKMTVEVGCEKYDLMPKITKFDKNNERVNLYAFNVFRAEKQKYDFVIIPNGDIKLNDLKSVELKVVNPYTDKKVKDVVGVFVDNTKLTILPGANINLVQDASFVSYSPVIAKGVENNKIYVRGEADSKGENFAVLDNDGLSEFEYVEFSGGGESTVNGAFFSGMLAIHHADSILRYNKFENATGDDALNIKYASSTVANNLFVANSADAIDYDFSDGVIEYNDFRENGNDAVDTSGSPVIIRYNKIRSSGDKCISSGEKSTPIIFNNLLDG